MIGDATQRSIFRWIHIVYGAAANRLQALQFTLREKHRRLTASPPAIRRFQPAIDNASSGYTRVNRSTTAAPISRVPTLFPSPA